MSIRAPRITPAALLAAWAAVPEDERYAFVTEALTEEAADMLLAAQVRQAAQRQPLDLDTPARTRSRGAVARWEAHRAAASTD